MLYIAGLYDKDVLDDYDPNRIMVNTTSRSPNWSRGLSPFYVGQIPLYNGMVSLNMENAWQFAKVYEEVNSERHIDEQGNPNDNYWQWARRGWADSKAYRYPAGKGNQPFYSYWDGHKYDYLEARRQIYLPCYAKAVVKTEAFEQLTQLYLETKKNGKDLWLLDFDGYNHKAKNLSYQEVLNNPNKKMGHAFVLGMILEYQIDNASLV